VIALDSHIRLANPRTKETQSSLMMRRGYSYSLGDQLRSAGYGAAVRLLSARSGKGLPDGAEALNGEALEEYKPIGGGYFFALPGVRDQNAYLAQGLLEA
jgi:deferrochelatase/peroxidase EfeB